MIALLGNRFKVLSARSRRYFFFAADLALVDLAAELEDLPAVDFLAAGLVVDFFADDFAVDFLAVGMAVERAEDFAVVFFLEVELAEALRAVDFFAPDVFPSALVARSAMASAAARIAGLACAFSSRVACLIIGFAAFLTSSIISPAKSLTLSIIPFRELLEPDFFVAMIFSIRFRAWRTEGAS